MECVFETNQSPFSFAITPFLVKITKCETTPFLAYFSFFNPETGSGACFFAKRAGPGIRSGAFFVG
jgi:hypothetical protein